MSLFTRTRRHVDMNRVKELREKKIKEEKIADIQKQQENILAELKKIEIKESLRYSNWRTELKETMTTAGMGMVNYGPGGDVNLETVSNSVSSVGSNPTASGGNGNYNFGAVAEGGRGSSISLSGTINVTKYDTLKFNFQSGTIDTFYVVTSGGQRYNLTTGSGTKVVKFNQTDRNKKQVQIAFHVERGGSSNLSVGNNAITNLSYQRRTPINVFVPLDDPEANAFIRGGLGGSEERKQKLKEQLEAGNELMIKMRLEPSKTSPGDIELASHDKPFSKYPAAGGDDKWPGLPQDAIKNYLHPSKDPLLNIPITPFGLPKDFKAQTGDAQVARINDGPMDDPSNIQWPRNNPYKKPQPGPGYKPPVKKAKKQTTMVAHYDPQGEVLSDNPKYSNWRTELKETMTIAGLGMINLEPNLNEITPEDDINADAYGGPFPADGSLSNGIWTMQNAPDPGNGGITISLKADLSRSDTISTQVYFNNATIDPAYGMDLVLNGPIGSSLQQVIPLSVPGSGTGSTNPLIAIDPKLRIKDVILSYSVIGNGGSGREIGNNSIRITSTVPFRRSPMALFVPLDDPEANAFIRGGLGGDKEKRKKLKDMLDSGNKLMIQNGMEPSKTSPGDIELADMPYVRDGRRHSPGSTTPSGAARDSKNMKWDPHMKTWAPNIPKA